MNKRSDRMKTTAYEQLYRTLIACTALSCIATYGLSQDAHTKKTDQTKEESMPGGLRKITPHCNWDFDIRIDEEALRSNIDLAVENAMKSVERVEARMFSSAAALRSIS